MLARTNSGHTKHFLTQLSDRKFIEFRLRRFGRHRFVFRFYLEFFVCEFSVLNTFLAKTNNNRNKITRNRI